MSPGMAGFVIHNGSECVTGYYGPHDQHGAGARRQGGMRYLLFPDRVSQPHWRRRLVVLELLSVGGGEAGRFCVWRDVRTT